MHPGLRLRQARERLGLTYREVERASYELAARRGRPEFILHISRLAEIENRGVVPGLHKLYTLAVVYHLNPHDIFAGTTSPSTSVSMTEPQCKHPKRIFWRRRHRCGFP
jgi:transcriptional regulator with XRE-family HTH domain